MLRNAQAQKQRTSESIADWLIDNSLLTRHAFSIRCNDSFSKTHYVISIKDNPNNHADNQFWISKFSKTAFSKKLQSYHNKKTAILAKSQRHQGQNVLHFILSQPYSSLTNTDVVLCGYSISALTDYKFSFADSNRNAIELESKLPFASGFDPKTQKNSVFTLFQTHVVIAKNAGQVASNQQNDSWESIKRWIKAQKRNKIIGKLLTAQDNEGKTPAHRVFSNVSHLGIDKSFSILLDALHHADSHSKNKLIMTQDGAGNNLFHALLQSGLGVDLDAFLNTLLENNQAGRDFIRGALLQRNNDGYTPILYLLKSHHHKLCQLLLPFLNRDDFLLLTQLKNREGRNALFYYNNWRDELDNTQEREVIKLLHDEFMQTDDTHNFSDNEYTTLPSYKEWLTEDDSNEIPLYIACQTGKLNEVKSVVNAMSEDGFEWATLDLHTKMRAFVLACKHGKPNMLDYLCAITPPEEILSISTKCRQDIVLSLASNGHQITDKDYSSIISKHTGFHQIYAYLTQLCTHKVLGDNNHNFKLRLLDFVTVLRNVEEGQNPFTDTLDFFRRDYKFFSGTERYHELRNNLCNHTPIITGNGHGLVKSFTYFLSENKHNPVATIILDELNKLKSENRQRTTYK